MSFFNGIDQLPLDPILGLPILYDKDPRPEKVNLGIGAYRTEAGLPFIFNSVKKAQSLILNKYDKEYLPIDGLTSFLAVTIESIFGKELNQIGKERVYATQTIGGTGALREGGDFLKKMEKCTIFLPQPSWPNHKPIFEKAGLNVGSYPYFDYNSQKLDFSGLCQAIENFPVHSSILLHACCHNPTGVDPNREQWKQLSHLLKKRKIFPFFDCAYQGFSEDFENDSQAIKQFALDGHEMFIAYSFAKNFGLYGERVGALAILFDQLESREKISSHICSLIRGNYSSPPLHGAQIVSTILRSYSLTKDWLNELQHMRDRIKEMRKALVAALLVQKGNKNLHAVFEQKGLFSFIGLNKEQVQTLRQEYGIYIPFSGRLNLAGLNTTNIDYVVKSLSAVL